MKTKWMIIPVVALALGCTREIEDNSTHIEGEFTLYATSDGKGTKTVLQKDGCVFWSPSDCINVFYGDKSGKFTSNNTEPAAFAEFTGSLGEFTYDGETEFVAVYPYSEATSYADNTLSVTLPCEQTAIEGSFADDLFICVAKTPDYDLFFLNACGGVKFSLARGDIKKVVFRSNNGEQLAGRIDMVFDNNIPVITNINGSSSVSLLAPDGGTFKAGAFYYIVLAPQVLTKGYTMEFYTDELVDVVSSESSVSVNRSAWGVLKNLAVPEMVDLGLSVMWGTKNIGASKPEGFGYYFAWGEIEPKDYYTKGTYKWYVESEGVFSKYNLADNRMVLDLEDDVAHVQLGDKWRIPTKEEYQELKEYCDWTWYEEDDHCYIVRSKINGNFIILPAAGGKNSPDGYFGDGHLQYWTSSLFGEAIQFAHVINDEGFDYYYRHLGHTIRPVYGDYAHSVESISLDRSVIDIALGGTYNLVATILPENATNKNITWSSSNESVATVSSAGVVTGVALGSAVITVITSDGGKTARCNVTVKESSYTVAIPEAIDLGIPSGLKWASFNLGATKPEEYGDYYAWGEKEPYYYSYDPLLWKDGKENGYDFSSYKWCMGSFNTQTKYCSDPSYGYNGFTDDKSVLEPEDDAAYMALGSRWRIPTDAEWTELRENCTWTWATQNNVNGFTVAGPNGNSIFLPAAGNLYYCDFYSAGFDGDYWSSSINTDKPYYAWGVNFYSTNVNRYYNYRYRGLSVRPVSD